MSAVSSRWTSRRATDDSEQFVGRCAELALLHESAERLDGGTWRFVELIGDPGIGKTALLTAFARESRAAGRQVLFWRCRDGGHGCLETNLRALKEILGTAGMPVVGEVSDHEAVPKESPHGRFSDARRMLEEFGGLGEAAILVLDDAHLGCHEVEELSVQLINHPRRARLLIVLAHRPRQLPPRLAGVFADAHHEGLLDRLELGPLGREEVNEILGQDTESDLRESVYQRSGGNPLYVHALRPSAETRTEAPGRRRPAVTGVVPPSVRAVITGELDVLSPSAQLVARSAAVIGDGFSHGMLEEITGSPHAEVLAALDELGRNDVIRQAGCSPTFRFRHPVVCAVIYGTTPLGWRLTAHKRVAEAMQRMGASPIAQAPHIVRGACGGDLAASETLMRAAEQAMLEGAGTQASRWFDVAYMLMPGQARQERLAALFGLARALWEQGRYLFSRSLLSMVVPLVTEGEPLHGSITEFIAVADRELGHGPEAVAGTALEEELAGYIDSLLGAVIPPVFDWGDDWPGSGPQTRREDARAALSPAGFTPDGHTAMASVQLGLDSFFAGDLLRAVGYRNHAAGIIDKLTDSQVGGCVEALLCLVVIDGHLERFEDGLRYLDRAVPIALREGRGQLLAPAHSLSAWLHRSSGELGRALSAGQEALRAAERSGQWSVKATALVQLMSLALDTGDLPQAVAWGEEALELSAGMSQHRFRSIRPLLTLARTLTGRRERCVSVIVESFGGRELPELAATRRAHWFEVLIWLDLVGGSIERAQAWLDLAERHCVDMPHAAAAGSLHLGRSLILLESDPVAARQEAEWAATKFSEGQAKFEQARAVVVLSGALEKAGRNDDATRALTRAELILESCGAPSASLRVSTGFHPVAAFLRTDRRPPEPRAAADAGGEGETPLSAREWEVARLVAEGCTNRRIARNLGVSEKTVESHMTRIFTKLRLASRAAVASKVTRLSTQHGVTD